MSFFESFAVFGAMAIVAIFGLAVWELIKISLHDCWHKWAPWGTIDDGKQVRFCTKCNKGERRSV
jgi:uncharacterized paraquat-inducible protein A